jgi:hypothetical protein
VTQVVLQGALTKQPLEYQLGYAGTIGGRAAQLVLTADDFSPTGTSFTLQNHGCSPDGTQTPQYPGTLVPIGDHQACLVTAIQDAVHLGWIESDGVSILLQASGLGVEQLEAIGRSVHRVPGELALTLSEPPPAGLELVGQGERPHEPSTVVEFDQDGCSYVVMTSRTDPVPGGFNPYAAPTTVRGAPGRIIGIGTLAWTADDATMTIGILAPDVAPGTSLVQLTRHRRVVGGDRRPSLATAADESGRPGPPRRRDVTSGPHTNRR